MWQQEEHPWGGFCSQTWAPLHWQANYRWRCIWNHYVASFCRRHNSVNQDIHHQCQKWPCCCPRCHRSLPSKEDLHVPTGCCWSSPTVSNSQLCIAQQVRNTSSAALTPNKRIPVFRIRQRPLRIPNVHPTSFLMDSSHAESQILLLLLVDLIGGTAVECNKQPLSTSNHAHPWYWRFTTIPLSSRSYNSNCTSSRIAPWLNCCMKSSNNDEQCLVVVTVAVIYCEVVSPCSVGHLETLVCLMKPVLTNSLSPAWCELHLLNPQPQGNRLRHTRLCAVGWGEDIVAIKNTSTVSYEATDGRMFESLQDW